MMSLKKDEERWASILKHPTRVLIIGASGSGKSATAHYIAELQSKTLSLPVYVYAVDPRKHSLYPPSIRHVGKKKVLPENAILLIDEAAIECPSRRSMSEENIELAGLAYKARHKRLTTVAVTQASSELDRVLVESAEIIVVKKPRRSQSETDRLHLRRTLKAAEKSFEKLDSSEDSRGWGYVEHSDGDEMLRTGLASWWTEELSHILAEHVTEGIHPRRLPREKREQLARDLRSKGWSYAKIGKELKVAKTTAWYYVKGYPQKEVGTRVKDTDTKRVGGETLVLRLPTGVQHSLLWYARKAEEDWGVPLRRDEKGEVCSDRARPIPVLIREMPKNELVGFAMSRELTEREIETWLKMCSDGNIWPGIKVDIRAKPSHLQLRTWPSGSHWFSEVLYGAEKTSLQLKTIAEQRPVFEILTPVPLMINSDGGLQKYEEDFCQFHGEMCWLRIRWLGEEGGSEDSQGMFEHSYSPLKKHL
jgi:hypothetical protein